MVQVRNLKKFFRGRRTSLFGAPPVVRAVDEVSFDIPEGKTLGLVGESGSGKTTTARSLLRLIEPDDGEIQIDGRDVRSLNRSALRQFRKNMQIVFQDPFGSLNPRMNVASLVSEPLRVFGEGNKTEINQRLRDLLDIVGLKEEHGRRYIHEFSGGQRQRIGIARAIALNPKVVVLDEPVSALDVSIQGQILNLLRNLQERFSLTYLFVAHDLAVVENMSNEIAVMYLGRIVEQCAAGELYRNPLHPYSQSLIAAIPEPKPKKGGFTGLQGEIPSPENPPGGCHFHPRCPHVMDICRSEYPSPRFSGGHRVRCHLY
jgi:peptide/nickel transport system ATP-binding protein/oligopeptide transport system ATP-binding protein